MEGKTDCWDRMMHSWVLEGEESWGRRTRRRNGGREGRGGYRVHGRGAETEPRGRRKGDDGAERRAVGRACGHRDTREKKGCRTQGRPAGLPAAPQEAERPQRSHSSPSGTPRGEHHHHRGAHLSHTRKHTLALAASHGHPRHLSHPSCTPRHSPCLTSRQDSFPRAPGAETTEPTSGFLRAHSHQQADRGRGSHSSQLGNHVRNSRKARTSGTGSQPLSLCGKARDWIEGAANGSVEPGRGGRGPNTPPSSVPSHQFRWVQAMKTPPPPGRMRHLR